LIGEIDIREIDGFFPLVNTIAAVTLKGFSLTRKNFDLGNFCPYGASYYYSGRGYA
jgi:hypothetical protein